jgi:hypothetical protein
MPRREGNSLRRFLCLIKYAYPSHNLAAPGNLRYANLEGQKPAHISFASLRRLCLREASSQFCSQSPNVRFSHYIQVTTRDLIDLQFPSNQSPPTESQVRRTGLCVEENHATRVDVRDILSCSLVPGLKGIEHSESRWHTTFNP